MYEHTIDRLDRAGLAMYEISNFARPGHESRHNLVYWANDAYFGVGLGAARYVRGVRSVEHPRPARLPPADRGRRAGDRPDRDARPRGPRPRDGRPDAPAHRRSASTAPTSGAGPASTSTPWRGPRSRGSSGEACSRTTAAASGSPARGCSWPTASSATCSESRPRKTDLRVATRGRSREWHPRIPIRVIQRSCARTRAGSLAAASWSARAASLMTAVWNRPRALALAVR